MPTKPMPLGPVMLDLSGDLELDPVDRARLVHPAVGGVILFSRNFASREQLRALTAAIHALRTPPLLVAVDQEGGRVQRFREGFTPLPAARRYGELYDEDPQRGLDIARQGGWVMASELRSVGVDFSFAPVLDVLLQPSDVIGDRAFHARAAIVVALAGAFIDGMAQAGMRATGKHFPGHGGVGGDSHHCLPCDHRQYREVERVDLVPYRRLGAQLGGVMTAHVLFDSVDDQVPTYSRYWIGEVLRRQLGFRGVVFSDDLSMHGAHGAGDVPRRVSRALAAGCDMALVCNDSPAIQRLLQQDGEPADRAASDHRAAMRPVTVHRPDPTQWARALATLEALA